MPVAVRCPRCEHRFRVPDSYAGQRGKCPKCKEVFVARSETEQTLAKSDNTQTKKVSRAPEKDQKDEETSGGTKTVAVPKPRLLSQLQPTESQDERTSASGAHQGVTPPPAPPDPKRLQQAQPAAPVESVSAPPAIGIAVDKSSESRPTAGGPASESVFAQRRKKRSKTPLVVGGFALALLAMLAVAALSAWSLMQQDGWFASDDTTSTASTSDTTTRNGSTEKGNDSSHPRLPPPVHSAREGIDNAPFGAGRAAFDDWEAVQESLVELAVITRAGETRSGRGVIVDRRGWVATTSVLLQDASDAVARLGSGQTLEVAGVLARRPAQNMALLKLAGRPGDETPEFAALEVNAEWSASEHEQPVYVGNLAAPLPAAINDVVDFYSLPASDRVHMPAELRDRSGVKLLEISQRIPVDLDGAPLLLSTGEVVGMSVNLGPKRQGYALPADALNEMLAAVDPERLEPFEKPQRSPLEATPPSSEPSPFDKFQPLVDRTAEFDWRPTTNEQYEWLQMLAENLTEMQALAAENGNDLPPAQRAKLERLQAAIDKTIERLEAMDWPEQDDMTRINELGLEVINAADKEQPGVFLYGKCVMRPEDFGSRTVDDLPGFAFELVGTGQFVVIGIGQSGGQIEIGSQWLILGAVDLTDDYELTLPESKKRISARVVRSNYLFTPAGEP